MQASLPFSLSIVLLLIIASYIRLYFSVDLEDESFYITLPYRFILGDHPIQNESSICQFAGILIYPFYKLFYCLQHNTQGIVLYGRHLFFIFYSVLGWLTYTVLKKELSKNVALLFSCICILYVPYNVLGLSYNTLAMFFFTAAAFLSLLDYQNKFKGKSNLILAGFLYSLSVFSYPPLIFPALISTLVIASTNGYRRTFINFLVGCIPVVLVSLFLLIEFRSELLNIYYWLKQTGHTNKDSSVLSSLFNSWLYYILFFKTLIFCTIGLITFNLYQCHKITIHNPTVKSVILGWGYLSLILLPFSFLIGYTVKSFQLHNHFILYNLLINLSLLAPFYYLLTNKSDFSKKLFLIIWVPSFAAGFVTSFLSNTGLLNGMVGLFPAFIASAILIYLALKKFFYDDLSETVSIPMQSCLKILPSLSIFAFLGMLVFFKFAVIVRSPPLSQLQSPVAVGPYKFLYTSYAMSAFLEGINEDLTYVIQTYHPKNVLVYPKTFGLYLASNLRPLTNSIWLESQFDNQMTLDYFERYGQKPELVILINSILSHNQDDNLLKFITSGEYLELLNKDVYSIYILKKLIH